MCMFWELKYNVSMFHVHLITANDYRDNRCTEPGCEKGGKGPLQRCWSHGGAPECKVKVK
jgi:hypothetical protein